MAFHTDQRRGNYRFLAEHAARPRYIWLARHIVWLGALIIVWFLLIGGFAVIVGYGVEFTRRQMFENYLEWGIHPNRIQSSCIAWLPERRSRSTCWSRARFGALVAYGIGQLFSMAIRSEILAAFLALLLALVRRSVGLGSLPLATFQRFVPAPLFSSG